MRELLLAGHLIDRSGMPHLIARLGRQAMAEVAIGEWRAASPTYTQRMQQLLGFSDPTVASIFKGMQLDIGAPPEFLDFRYEIDDDDHGRFHLDHCGALMDVEPMGDEYVTTMCHDIEDPTFDATAAAANPRARVRPVHRPPRLPADRQPHCEWTVTIDHDADPLPYPAEAQRLAESRAAHLALAERPTDLPDDDGASDYRGALDPDLVMERFSSATLAALADEISLQGHLLSRGYLLEVADRIGDEVVAVGVEQAAGIAGLTAKRLARLVGSPTELRDLAAILEIHPLFLPRTYVDLRVAVVDQPEATRGQALRVALGPCPALDEPDGLTWPALLAGPRGSEILGSITACVAPTARVEPTDTVADERAAWLLIERPGAEPTDQPTSVTLTEFSSGADFVFTRRG